MYMIQQTKRKDVRKYEYEVCVRVKLGSGIQEPSHLNFPLAVLHETIMNRQSLYKYVFNN